MGAAGKVGANSIELGLRVGTWHCSAVQEAKENSNLTQGWVSNSLYGNYSETSWSLSAYAIWCFTEIQLQTFHPL